MEHGYASCMASSSLALPSDPVTSVWAGGQAREMFLGRRKLESDLKFNN